MPDSSYLLGRTLSPTHKHHKKHTVITLQGNKSTWFTTFYASNDAVRWQVVGFLTETIIEWGTYPERSEGTIALQEDSSSPGGGMPHYGARGRTTL